MPVVTGIFTQLEGARRTLKSLPKLGIALDQIHLLTPGAAESELASVPTTDAEQPGVGKAFGGLLGGALGAAGGLQLGATAASLMVPGVGPIFALGAAGVLLLGVGGAAGGAALGRQFDESATKGLPIDELYLYKDALRRGRTVVIVPVSSEEQREKIKELMASAGAESLDVAKESWWIGLRDAEEAHYLAREVDFKTVETTYRLGFEAAQQPETYGKSFEEALPFLRERYSVELCNETAFREGYDRGKQHLEVSEPVPLRAL